MLTIIVDSETSKCNAPLLSDSCITWSCAAGNAGGCWSFGGDAESRYVSHGHEWRRSSAALFRGPGKWSRMPGGVNTRELECVSSLHYVLIYHQAILVVTMDRAGVSATSQRQRTRRIPYVRSPRADPETIRYHKVRLTRDGIRYTFECGTCGQLFTRKRDAVNHCDHGCQDHSGGLYNTVSSSDEGSDGSPASSCSAVRPRI